MPGRWFVSICTLIASPLFAWDNMSRDTTAQLIHRSNIILQQPNLKPEQAMPLGNGRLGLAVWGAGGLTLQMNRADTLPKRLSPGQVSFPGLTSLSSSAKYQGELRLWDGEFLAEDGNGASVSVYVQPESDAAVVEAKGADPARTQRVLLRLWEPRHPKVVTRKNLAVLAETWTDSGVPGATGWQFGSLAGISVDGTRVAVTPRGTREVELSFRPHPDGSYRVLIAAPHWSGTGNPAGIISRALQQARATRSEAHRIWWHQFWERTGKMQIASSDGSGEYLENLRAIYLFTAAAGKGDRFPGSQAGVADLFSSAKDFRKWDPGAYWHFNLRMQVAANLGAGLFTENEPYFRLYRENLNNVVAWTENHMRGLPGVCVPETMRFNGQGFENEDWIKSPGLNCDAASQPYYNARTLSTGAEVSGWIWRQYLATDDRAFLAANYPVMAASARFLLAYSTVGQDGKRHTFPTNAHENEWDVHDSTNDICAMRSLFPAVMEAARTLGRDQDLVQSLRSAISQIREFPEQEGPEGKIIGLSYDLKAEIHNTENVGLEPVWPYGLIGDTGEGHELAVRTYQARPNKMQNDWSFDPLQAARLGLANEVKTTLIGLTEKYQSFPSGLASFVGPEFYVEQIGNVAAALQEALVQDYDGVIRIAPAWPADWDVTAELPLQHRSQLEISVHNANVDTVTLHSGYTGIVHLRNPWHNGPLKVVAAGHTVAVDQSDDIISFPVQDGISYQISSPSMTATSSAPEHAAYASGPRRLGSRSIGLMPATAGR